MSEQLRHLVNHLEIATLKEGNRLCIATGEIEHPAFNFYFDFEVTQAGDWPIGMLIESDWPGTITLEATPFMLQCDLFIGRALIGSLPEKPNELVVTAGDIFKIEI